MLLLNLVICGIPYTDNLFKKHLKEFNETNINGILINVDIVNHGTGFKINTSKYEFVFYPINGNRGNSFEDIADKGDSGYKPAFSDTLFLFKNKKVYKFYFRKD